MPATSTTTPAPCICENMPDKITINVKTGLFRDYCRRIIPQEHLNKPYIYFFNGDLGDNQTKWRIDNKMVELDPNNPFVNLANILNVGLQYVGSVPLVFKKMNPPVEREGCDAYESRGNSIPLQVRIAVGQQLPNLFDHLSPVIVLTFEAVMFLDNGDWNIKFIVKGNLAEGFTPKIMTNVNPCPQNGEFVEVVDGDQFVDVNINDSGSDDLETIAMMMPPFKNSLLGY